MRTDLQKRLLRVASAVEKIAAPVDAATITAELVTALEAASHTVTKQVLRKHFPAAIVARAMRDFGAILESNYSNDTQEYITELIEGMHGEGAGMGEGAGEK